MSIFNFQVNYKKNYSRLANLQAKNGNLSSPAFMPVGTAASVKGVYPENLLKYNTECILANTYHLMLRPGEDVVENAGGIHKFMNWKGLVITDSGGFQVMSLANLRKVTEDGVKFRSHIDGSEYFLTPEKSIEIQNRLGSDITMIFDECIKFPSEKFDVAKSMELSLRWAKRSKDAFVARNGYGLFGIVQGGAFEDLRKISANELVKIGFDGYAIGGLAVGEPQEVMFEVLDYTIPLLPEDKPRYLMGVGMPTDIIGAVMRGVDIFDCVIPTRCARNGMVFTSAGILHIRNAKFKYDTNPLDVLDNYVCKNYTKSYIHHLFRCNEMLGPMLLTEHNIAFYQNLMQEIRDTIGRSEGLENLFDKYKAIENTRL